MDKFLMLKAMCGVDAEYECDCDEDAPECTCEIGQGIDEIYDLLEKIQGHDENKCFCNDCRKICEIGVSEIAVALKDIVGTDKNYKLDCKLEHGVIVGGKLWIIAKRNGKEIGRILVDESRKKAYYNLFTFMLGVSTIIEKAGYTDDVKVPKSRKVVLDPDYTNVINNLKDENPGKFLSEIYPNIKVVHNCHWCGEDEIKLLKVKNSEEDLYRCSLCEHEHTEEHFAMVHVDAYCPTCEEVEEHWIQDLEEKDNHVIGECNFCDKKNAIKIDVLKKVATV